ncbi:hypothetical protein D3C76_1772230 [compost metagenome]
MQRRGVVAAFVVKLRLCRQLDEVPERVVIGLVGRSMNNLCSRPKQQMFRSAVGLEGIARFRFDQGCI